MLPVTDVPASAQTGRGSSGLRLSAVVDFASVSDGDDENEHHVVVDLVHDPVVASADAPIAISTHELLDSARSGLDCQQLDRGLHPAPGRTVHLAQLPTAAAATSTHEDQRELASRLITLLLDGLLARHQ